MEISRFIYGSILYVFYLNALLYGGFFGMVLCVEKYVPLYLELSKCQVTYLFLPHQMQSEEGNWEC